MDQENTQRRFESVYSSKVRAGKRRTYFFDVRKTKGDDFYITLTESTKRFNSDGYERHKIFLYKEDFNRFMEGLSDAVEHVKTNLMPDYDYDEFTRRQAEWDQKRAEEAALAQASEPAEPSQDVESQENGTSDEVHTPVSETKVQDESEEDDDMSW